MEITLNGVPRTVPDGTTLLAARDCFAPGSDVWIYQGFQTRQDVPLRSGDSVVFIETGRMPDEASLEAMLSARHTPRVYERLKQATVGIAGLGGLGSHLAAMLARSGVGTLVLADFDVVEPSNLNRQNYFLSQLGQSKAEATRALLRQAQPYVAVEAHAVRVTPDNAATLFGACDVVCEAFDDPAQKAMLVGTLLERLPHVFIVASSGMAGYASANAIRTARRMKRFYLCGDGETAAEPGCGLMAPRVSVCAGHQANMALRLLLGEETP